MKSGKYYGGLRVESGPTSPTIKQKGGGPYCCSGSPMSEDDQEIFEEFVQESREHLAAIEPDLLEMERQGSSTSSELVNRVFRAIHSTKGGAAFLSFESLKEFNFFTFAKADGKKSKFVEPVDYYLENKDGALTLHFILPLKAPVTSKQLALEVFDPSYFIDFKFEDKDPIKLVGAPAACQMQFQRPNDETANTQRLSEQNFMNGDNSNYGAMFANKIMVNCP